MLMRGVPKKIIFILCISCLIAITTACDKSKSKSDEISHSASVVQQSQSAQRVASVDKAHVEKIEQNKIAVVRRAAEDGNAEAQELMCRNYVSGYGGTVDYHKAFSWCQKSADQGRAGAQYVLGWMYKYGLGVEKNDSQAASWFKKGADQGDLDAQCDLGSAYVKGRGVSKDVGHGMQLILASAEKGLPKAQYFMGAAYIHAVGVERDYRKAMGWNRKAAEQGYIDAQRVLGIAHQKGDGVEKDLVQAHKWLSLAGVENGDAKKRAKQLEQEMSAAQLQLAKEMALRWKSQRKVQN
ncbi:MAG: sel1 repeat family protein [Oxalobacter sp.]|nr:MAG: sel1 repeat family protein [Oxalobacter sp.]